MVKFTIIEITVSNVQDDDAFNAKISNLEIKVAIQSLKRNGFPGTDLISNECINI